MKIEILKEKELIENKIPNLQGLYFAFAFNKREVFVDYLKDVCRILNQTTKEYLYKLYLLNELKGDPIIKIDDEKGTIWIITKEKI